MTLEEKVFALLSADPVVSALVPAPRIKPPGDWQNLPRPYISHVPVAPTPEYMHDGRVPLTEWLYDVKCVADVYTTARAVAVAVVSALSGQHDGIMMFWKGQVAIYVPEIGVHGVHEITLTFQIFEAL